MKYKSLSPKASRNKPWRDLLINLHLPWNLLNTSGEECSSLTIAINMAGERFMVSEWVWITARVASETKGIKLAVQSSQKVEMCYCALSLRVTVVVSLVFSAAKSEKKKKGQIDYLSWLIWGHPQQLAQNIQTQHQMTPLRGHSLVRRMSLEHK